MNWLNKIYLKLRERRDKNIKFKKEFKEITGVDLNNIHIGNNSSHGI
tara:strand:+ start:154 stop:294 length:141 start_codon:yes stop_codon:yes gene_type:complete